MFTFTGRTPLRRRLGDACPAPVLAAADADVLRAHRAELLRSGACMVKRRREIRRILIVLNDRPAFAEIADFRRIAEEVSVDMSVDGTGTVLIRRRVPLEGVREPGGGMIQPGVNG